MTLELVWSVTIGEVVVAIGTLALAGATFWLAREARKARTEAEEHERRTLLRAALVEQLDNCRAWITRDPARGGPAAKGLQGASPRLAAVNDLLGQLDLPPDLAAHLIWLTSAIGDHWGRIEVDLDELPTVWGSSPPALQLDGTALTGLTDDWRVMVEHLQTLAALVAAEARRRKMPEVAALHDVVPWTIVPERPPRWRELMALGGVQRGDAPFPADAAFGSVRPEARDRAGGATGERQREALSRRSASSQPNP
jgi:hypothetical protein